jgi:hypothetical protein
VKPTAKPITRTPPRAKSQQTVKKQSDAPRPEFGQLLSDLRSGVSRLGQLAGQLAASRQRTGMPQVPTARRPSPEVTKLIERELRTVTKVVPGASTEIIREYRQLAERATKLHVPQSHAALLEGARRLKPAEVMRPTTKAVRSLMRATEAIRQGRLPFLPKETRREAQKLLNELFSKQTAVNISRSTRIPQVIEKERLIPQAVHGMAASSRPEGAPPSPLMHAMQKAVGVSLGAMQDAYRAPEAPPRTDLQGRTPVSAADLPRLAKALPSFEKQGLGVNGSLISHSDEHVSVVTRSDSPIAAESGVGESNPLAPAPQAKSSRTPVALTQEGSGPRTAGGAVQGAQKSQTSGPTRVEGTLSIPELGNAVAKFTGFMTDNGALT